MNYHIDLSPENSPTSISLYTTGKPVLGMSQMGGQDNDIEYEPDSEYYERLDDWIKSRYAYLQEPEFKYGRAYYLDGDKDKKGYPSSTEYDSELNWQPYFEGQKIDPSAISYVREVIKERSIHKTSYGEETLFEWQPAPEPEKMIGFGEALTINPDHTEWLKDLKSGVILATTKPNIKSWHNKKK